MKQFYYFGVWPNHHGDVGHFLYNTAGRMVHDPHGFLPIPEQTLDGGLLPKNAEPGQVHVAEIGGWWFYSFRDQTGDTRPGSVSVLITNQPSEFREFAAAFPAVFARLRKAELKLARGAVACTGLSASWCPVCGDCCCPNPEGAKDDENCPLHAPGSRHAEFSNE